MKKIIFLIILLLFLAFATAVYAAAKNVIVANTPLPIAGNVEVTNTPLDVNVKNEPLQVEVSNGDESNSKEPFQQQVEIDLPEGTGGQNGFVNVPAGKRLVIEYISSEGFLPSGQKMLFGYSAQLN